MITFAKKRKQAHIADKMRKCHLRWFGHVSHQPPDAPVCSCETMLGGGVKKGLGEPKIIWKKIFLKDL